MPSDFIYTGIVFVVLSLILQFLHLIIMSLFPKPNKELKTESPEKYNQEFVWEINPVLFNSCAHFDRKGLNALNVIRWLKNTKPKWLQKMD